ncbi:MAG: hypothetical protein HRT38_10555 [Alteromonadaceae bacterium]|nr:hypothetical protein [Alteromonadaceae bacterium]
MLVEINNVRFDDEHPKCFINFSQAEGRTFAFVQALDLGLKNCRHKQPMTKCCWGIWDHSEPEKSMSNILNYGAKWPSLPKLEKVNE